MAATQQSSLSSSFVPDANTIKSLSSGAFAGAISRTITSPLERLKVMKQVQASGTKYGGIVQALTHMYREEGLKSYWKGNGTNVARIAPFSAIQFFAFDAYKRKLFPEGETTWLRTLFAGALTGATASTICYPLDLVRSCLSVQTTNKQYNGIVHALVTIVKKEGPFGLYRGLTPTLVGIAPYIAINMTTFDLLRNHFMPSRDHEYATLINLLLGATAGGTAATITYPTDVVRRRIQLQGMNVEGLNLPKYSSTTDCVRQMIAQEGIAGLYKGLGPCLLKVVPSMAIAFMLYEGLRKHLKFDPPKNKAPSAG